MPDFSWLEFIKFKDIVFGILGLLTALGITIEFTPIKINPITDGLKWIGKKLLSSFTKQLNDTTRVLKDEMSEVLEELKTLSTEFDEFKCESYRNTILNFACEVRNGVKHTHDQYTRIFTTYTNYNRLIDKRKFPNDVMETEYRFIKDTFDNLMRDGSFQYRERR